VVNNLLPQQLTLSYTGLGLCIQVYLILMAQLAVTVGIICLFIFWFVAYELLVLGLHYRTRNFVIPVRISPLVIGKQR